MTLYVLIENSQIASGEKVIEDRPGMKDMSEAKRNALGWFAVVDQPPTYDPSKQIAMAGALALIGGVPVRQYTVTDLPVPPLMPITHEQLVALLLQKGTLQKTDIDAGVVTAAVAAQPDAIKPILADAAAVADAPAAAGK